MTVRDAASSIPCMAFDESSFRDNMGKLLSRAKLAGWELGNYLVHTGVNIS